MIRTGGWTQGRRAVTNHRALVGSCSAATSRKSLLHEAVDAFFFPAFQRLAILGVDQPPQGIDRVIVLLLKFFPVLFDIRIDWHNMPPSSGQSRNSCFQTAPACNALTSSRSGRCPHPSRP